jgi:hypothetical protein
LPFPPVKTDATWWVEPVNCFNTKNLKFPVEHSGIWKDDHLWGRGLIEQRAPWGGFMTREALNTSGIDPRSWVNIVGCAEKEEKRLLRAYNNWLKNGN